MNANSKQVAGDHYNKDGEQHWDRIWRLYGRGYFVGCATKYLERYHLKNGKEDLEKAIHFIEKLKELEYPEKAAELVKTIDKVIEELYPKTNVFLAGDKVAMVDLESAYENVHKAIEEYEGDATRAYVNQE